MKELKTVIIIPAYNEGKNIGKVINDIKKCSLSSDIIVVDDGSKDNTTKEAEKYDIHLIRHPVNMGKGESLKTGFKYVVSRQIWDVAVILDADGQHKPSEIKRFIDRYKLYKEKMIIGNRMKDAEGMPLDRFLTNKFTSALISLLINVRIPDIQCGFRLIDIGILQQIDLNTSRYDTEVELTAKVAKKGFSIGSLKISCIYRDEKSYINPIKDTARFIRLLGHIMFMSK